MEIYKPQELKKPSLIQKMFGKVPAENGLIEINNLFASHQTDIEKISLENIVEVAERYKINLKKKFKAKRLELFQKYLHHCLIDSKLEDSEIIALKHVKDILLLNEKDTQELLKTETEKLYQEQVKEAVSDGRLDNNEKENLERLKKDLLISDEIADKIYETNAKEILQSFIDGAISDQRLSPEEEVEINEIAKSLSIDLKVDDKSKEVLDRYKLYWQIENGELPTIDPDINIQKSENLYFRTSIKWLEQRKVTKRINYGGPTARIKIAKGVYYRMGSVGVQRVSEDVWQTIDSGQLYLTNKRLIFMGGKGNKTIRLNKILDLTPYKNGVDIQKETGKSPFLEFSHNVDIFSMILVRLMDEQ
ncbi:hypothetical protein [Saccharicrinis sp. 156]|uniref:hypothetical protein n=1 Tax=Saccharicrinis sp. 156 TaxID=3417574 RepID=UPI003D345D6D